MGFKELTKFSPVTEVLTSQRKSSFTNLYIPSKYKIKVALHKRMD